MLHTYTHSKKRGIQYRPSQSVDSVVRRLLAKPWMRERAAAAHSLSLSLSLSRPLTINIILTLRNFLIYSYHNFYLSTTSRGSKLEKFSIIIERGRTRFLRSLPLPFVTFLLLGLHLEQDHLPLGALDNGGSRHSK